MDLSSGYPFWSIRNGLMAPFPALDRDEACDVAIIGAGITGALIADELVEHGHDVVVIDERDVAWGSTSASTALLQYEIDTHLVDLAKTYGETQAVLAYRACSDAIDMLAGKAAELRNIGFRHMSSLYYASRYWHRSALVDEYSMRKRHGFDVLWFDRGGVQDRFGVDAAGAILSRKAACVDPYRMTCRLLSRVAKRGARVRDRTHVARIVTDTDHVRLETSSGHAVRAGRVVIAAGYATQAYLPGKLARNRSSYAYVTDPLPADMLGRLARTMLWESARPYLYMRPTDDGRLMIGGADDSVDIAVKRDALVARKARKLAGMVRKLFPHLQLEPAFAWGGTFAETDDGLPWFGAHRDTDPRILYAMAYGGNGITYSMLGAGLIRAAIEGRAHPLSGIFGFERRSHASR